MRRWARRLLLLLFFVPLVACQQQVCLMSPETDVTLIEIVKWDTMEHVAYLDDLALIRKLIRELDSAETLSIATRNIAAPEYKLLFFQQETKLYELGYYLEVMNIGLSGRYLDYNSEGLYGVTIRLNLH
ncbi:hypothetical protein [Bacillus alkalisoli]|uniref:hypothetical protein n=1 Tax=Bacillus alkalisoli TaxID=2011008 RepID=UPI000C238581|nr:hypothetical protein [Bacillus alkalisoli]